ASRRDAQVGVVALAAFCGLALGVAALVVSLALLAGFQTHVRSRLLAETPHLLVTPAGRGPFHDADRIGGKLAAVPGVVSVSPVARGRVWVSISRQESLISAGAASRLKSARTAEPSGKVVSQACCGLLRRCWM